MLGMRKDQLQPYEMMGTPPYVGSEGMRLAYTARVPSDPTYGGVPIITSGYHWSYIVPNIPVHDLKHRRPKVPIMSLPYLWGGPLIGNKPPNLQEKTMFS